MGCIYRICKVRIILLLLTYRCHYRIVYLNKPERFTLYVSKV